LKWLSTKENDRKYPLSPKYPGIMHFQLEKSGKYSRMNTLRAYRILRSWNILEELGDLE
jgi:hypothetical protein